ncbi:MAG: LexA repressor [Clostridia bacterium]|nr:LexA repressor [Clostridia bacterium]
MTHNKLTKRQQLVYDGIVEYQKEHGFAPSIRELCKLSGLASTSSVYAHLKSLEDLGYIKRKEDAPRAIAII